MVRISTIYDKEINEKVFMVRGDEAYTRTTDTLLSLVTDWANREDSIEGVRIGVTYDVLRDLGASTVTIYNWNTVLGIYDWDESDTETTIGTSSSGGFILPYGIEHRIWAKYKGNDKCLGSKSKQVKFTYDIPSSYVTQISFGATPTQISTGGTLSGSVTVTINDLAPSQTHSLPIKIYVDGVYNQTITTPSNSNTQTFTIDDLDDGKHIISAEVEATSQIRDGRQTMNLYVGYLLNIDSYPNPFFSGADNKILVSLHDMNNEPLSGKSVSFASTSATTDSNGVATFTLQSLANGDYYASYNNNVSQTITIANANITGISLTLEDSITTKGAEEVLTATLTGSNIANVPVTWKAGNTTSSLNTNANVISPTVSYTNSSGIATANYKGNNRGNWYVDANYGGYDSRKIIEDVEKYWHRESGANITYGSSYKIGGYWYNDSSPSIYSYYVKLQWLSNYLQLSSGNRSAPFGFYFEIPSEQSFVASFGFRGCTGVYTMYIGLPHKGVELYPNHWESNVDVKVIYTASTDSFKVYIDGVQQTANVVTQDNPLGMPNYLFFSVKTSGTADPIFWFNDFKYYRYNYGVTE